MIDRKSITQWLEELPDSNTWDISILPPPPPSTTKKRKAESQYPGLQLTSPPPSQSDMDVTPTRKRQRVTNRLIDIDLTPRPQDGSTRSSAQSQSQSSRSTRSSRSLSPKKQMMGLSLDDNGLECRQLEIDTAPEEMSQLLRAMREVANGHDILPYDRRDEILESTLVSDGKEWRYSFRPSGEEDSLPGQIPTIEQVGVIRDMAKECQNSDHEEAGWNVEVHHRILQSIFRAPGSSFNFSICTTARPSPEYLPPRAPAKMVDFCVFAELNQDERFKEAHRELSRHTPTLSVNHTDFTPLQLRPVTLSIETKKPDKELDAANLQMGIWHAAQWSFLTSAVGLSIRASQAADEPRSSLQQMETAKQVEARMDRLPFIPGVIVLGHKWSLVLSTREGQRTILWTEREFGNTKSIQETFQIVAGLRELAAWSKNVYLPWWKENVLDGFIA
ncbi:hypothetical protein FOYG_17271 [Fusarium oxysporum NRRL 32931]|uniref:PD-(D/E)XK nuclease-like domain-containing protein n=1 Tax=Fusarium oxysporum NRRL 32931 TaxID=660029 RepID=W9HBG4_FUSOX|nr:hypothetical protein FOYG_17271 [Fusarium oxysporum NRRL 32931]